jgi:hypothetical protein
MSRDSFSFDQREERGQDTPHANDQPRGRSGSASRPTEYAVPAPENRETHDRPAAGQRKPEEIDSARAYYRGERTYFVRDSELQTMTEIGTFRAIASNDLARFSYGGDTERMEREIRRLRQQSLVSERVLPVGRNKTIRLFALTKRGKQLLRNSGRIPDEQAIYHGFAKPREAKHDADLYRLYQAQAETIVRLGGQPTRVILDFELKRDLYRDLAAIPEGEQAAAAREGIAERHGLSVVDGKIPLPDLRVEYDTAEMEHKHLDLELATRNYRPQALAAKAKAGFSLYAPREDASRLRRVLDEHEITAQIFSL